MRPDNDSSARPAVPAKANGPRLRLGLLLLLVAFVASRATLVHYANNPDDYPFTGAPFTADVDNVYHDVAKAVDQGLEPYTEYDLEYAPGMVPFLLMPNHSWPFGDDYRGGFVKLMVLVDLAGLVGLVLLGRRWGSMFGPWAWVILVTVLGPVVLLRLDLVPAVATIWAIERASVNRWPSAGGWLGYGFAAKVYPGFLVPAAMLAAPRRLRPRIVVAAVTVAAVSAIAVISTLGGSPGEIFGDAFSSVGRRGLHLESTWGAILLLFDKLGMSTRAVFDFSTTYYRGGVETVLGPLALVLTVGVVVLGAIVARGARDDADPERASSDLASVAFATITLLVGLASLFSPQYMIWLVALGAVVLCAPEPRAGFWTPWLLLPIAVITQVLYPWKFTLISSKAWGGIIALNARNLLVVTMGMIAFVSIIRSQGPDGPVDRLRQQARRMVAGWRHDMSDLDEQVTSPGN